MVAPRTPNWRLNHSWVGKRDHSDVQELPVGSYVRPIEECYVPEHVKEANKYFHRSTETYCYTKFGIATIPTHFLEET